MNEFKKSFYLIVGLLFVVILQSCSSDNSDLTDPIANEKTEAPMNPTGEFKFYKGENIKWSFKVQPSSDARAAVVMINSSTAVVDGLGSFFYKKTGETEAELSCFFTTSIFIGGTKTYQWNQYELVLTFLSAHHGKFQGKQMKNPEDKGSTIEGYFVYDTDLELEEILDMHEEYQYTNSLNWDLLIDKKWSYSNSEYTLSYQFFTNGTFQCELKSDIMDQSSGKYSIDKKNNIIILDKIGDFKVYELTDTRLVMAASDLDKENARTFIAQDSKVEERISISKPIIDNITTSSANIKGTILTDDITLSEWGVCFGLKPNPTVSDNKLQAKSKIIDCELSNLYQGTKYYIKLYAIKDEIIYYGEEISFTTEGTFIENIEISEYSEKFNVQKNKSSIDLIVKLPNHIGSYGICYGKNKNPKITDNYLEEKNRADSWTLNNLDKGELYYVRAYHIDKTNIHYYDSSEIVIYPINSNYKIDYSLESVGSYFNMDYSLSIKYSLPETTYKVTTKVLRNKDAYYYMYGYNTNIKSFYIKGGNGELQLTGHLDIECGSSYYHLCSFSYYFGEIIFTPVEESNLKTITIVDGEKFK